MFTSAALTATGCAAEWPSSAIGVSTGSFAHRELSITTIDILPLDLQAWAELGYGGDLDQERSNAESSLMNEALDTLAAHHYQVGARIDWNGESRGAAVMRRPDLLATLGALAHYGDAVDEQPGRLPVPYLPARLGTLTDADATLYVGGWAYAAGPRPSTAEQVGHDILIGLAVVTVVAIAVILLSDHHDHHDRHHHQSSPHPGKASPAPSGGEVAPSSSGRSEHDVHHIDLHPVGRHGAAPAADAFGRPAVDIELSAPDWGDDDALPHDGAQSQMYLEATLIDNRTGLVVWHAHQTFPARLGRTDDTARAMRTLLAQLPAHTAPAAQR